MMITAILAVLLAAPARAAGAPKTADKTTIQVVEYMLKTPPEDADPKLASAFLAVDTSTLPPKLQKKAAAKQVQINALVRLHDTKKLGTFIQPAAGCSERDFVKGLEMSSYFPFPSYETVTEDELSYVMKKTKCTEIDLGCRFSMLIFFKKGKDRVIKFAAADPIMAVVAESRGKGGTTQFFGLGLTCLHD